MKHEILRLNWIKKSFGNERILKYIHFSLFAGEIHAITGANGVGKSTMLRIIGGQLQPSDGSIWVDGEKTSFADEFDAKRQGVYSISNNPEIVPQFNLGENLALQLQTTHQNRTYNSGAVKEHVQELLSHYGMTDILDSIRSGYRLSILDRQCIQILSALANGARILVIDEPFSTLDAKESADLVSILRHIRSFGVAIVLASHDMQEVSLLADRITVLRAGTCAETFENPGRLDLLQRTVLDIMANSSGEAPPVSFVSHARPEEIFYVRDLLLKGTGGSVSFNIRAGEVVGIASFGTFRSSVCGTLFGLHGRCRGQLLLAGKPVSIDSPTAAIQKGIGCACDNDEGQYLLPNFSAVRNITLPFLGQLFPHRFPVSRIETFIAKQHQDFLMLDDKHLHMPVSKLSCGLQKRLVLARWFSVPLKLLMLIEPFKYLDANARETVKRMIQSRTLEGASFLVQSADLDGLIAICDRVLLVRNGRMIGVLTAPDITRKSILSAALSNTAPGDDDFV